MDKASNQRKTQRNSMFGLACLQGMEIMMLQNDHQPVPDFLWAKPAPTEDDSSHQA